jgi:hypothetical protein
MNGRSYCLLLFKMVIILLEPIFLMDPSLSITSAEDITLKKNILDMNLTRDKLLFKNETIVNQTLNDFNTTQ